MATDAEWALGYARQAQADFAAWHGVEGNATIRPCHRLLFLQMACEKLSKARLIRTGTSPELLQTSHGYVAGPLPFVLREQLVYMGENPDARTGLLRFIRHLASEIEVANPAVDRNGQRPDNCEYPWEDGQGILHSPLDSTFQALQLLNDRRFGPSFLDLLRGAINRAVQELQ